MPICEKNMKKIKKMNVDIDALRKSIQLNLHNGLTTLYYLSLKK